MLTPYQYASNSPIGAIDIDGGESAFISDFKSQQARKQADITANLSQSNSAAVQARNLAAQKRASAIAVPPNTDHPEDRSGVRATIANIDYNKPENVMARYDQTHSPATIGSTPPPPPANDFEAGAVKGVQMAATGVAAEACPACFLVYGGVQTYNGIENKDANQIVSGGLNMAVGLFGMSSAAPTAETYYRTMSSQDYTTMVQTGKVPATSETFISPTAAYSSKYEGVLVQINTKPGTFEQLKSIGVRDATHPLTEWLNLPTVSTGWRSTNAFFKQEAGQVNIGLGNGKALETFNNNILSFKAIGQQGGTTGGQTVTNTTQP